MPEEEPGRPALSGGSVARADAAAAVRAYQDNVIGVAFGLGPHAGRAERHAGDGQANRSRPFGQKAADVGGRDMPLDRISADRGRVARGQAIGDAALALEVWAHRIRHYVGAYLAQLGGLDAVVFTAGIGENSARLRGRALAGLQHLGLDGAMVREVEAQIIRADIAALLGDMRTQAAAQRGMQQVGGGVGATMGTAPASKIMPRTASSSAPVVTPGFTISASASRISAASFPALRIPSNPAGP